MKISKVLHVISVMVGSVGIIVFAGAMLGGGDNLVFGITKFDSLFCTAILFLIAIWTQLGTMHHIRLEEKGELI